MEPIFVQFSVEPRILTSITGLPISNDKATDYGKVQRKDAERDGLESLIEDNCVEAFGVSDAGEHAQYVQLYQKNSEEQEQPLQRTVECNRRHRLPRRPNSVIRRSRCEIELQRHNDRQYKAVQVKIGPTNQQDHRS